LFAFVQIAYALAVVGLLAILSPAADARRLLQSSSITDADILNFALNLEVSSAFSSLLHLQVALCCATYTPSAESCFPG